jgi:hypothetical protein
MMKSNNLSVTQDLFLHQHQPTPWFFVQVIKLVLRQVFHVNRTMNCAFPFRKVLKCCYPFFPHQQVQILSLSQLTKIIFQVVYSHESLQIEAPEIDRISVGSLKNHVHGVGWVQGLGFNNYTCHIKCSFILEFWQSLLS